MGGGGKGRNLGAIKLFSRGNGGGGGSVDANRERGYRKLTANQLPLMEGGRVGHKNITEP